MPGHFSGHPIELNVYARHTEDPELIEEREPFGLENIGLELNAERLKAVKLKGMPLNFCARISFCQMKIVLTINYLVHLPKVSKQGGMNSKTSD